MTDTIDTRLSTLGITLPTPAAPVASYKPAILHQGILTISGQLPFIDGELATGKLGADVSLEQGQVAARACGMMILAQARAVLGSLDRVEQVIKLGGFVASLPDFHDQPKVINGASDLMEEVFSEAGRHARSAVGVPVLPLNAAVEVDAIIAVRD